MSNESRQQSTLVELAALAETVERCRARIVELSETQRLADRTDQNSDNGLLVAIYEAERGLVNAIRLLQRASRVKT